MSSDKEQANDVIGTVVLRVRTRLRAGGKTPDPVPTVTGPKETPPPVAKK